MTALPFGEELVRALAERRTGPLTALFQTATFLGDLEGYVLVVTAIYVAWDKRLALRLAVVTLLTTALNHALKTLIANPRPFVAEGSQLENWAVSPARAARLAAEFSTPSGHAMASAAFYAYLYGCVRSRAVRAACVVLIVLIGLSRPYLGVHYLEDVLLGWLLGIALALLALRHVESLGERWARIPYPGQVAIAVGASLALWLATRALDPSASAPPSAFLGYAGFLTGIAVAAPLETSRIGFDPRPGSAGTKALRYGLAVALILGALSGLDALAGALAREATPTGQILFYLRYFAAAVVAYLVCPLLFVKLGLAAGARSTPAFRAATPGDLDALLALQRAYYGEDGYGFDPDVARTALARLLADPALGQAWLAEQDGRAVAYAVLTLGWSLELGGRDAFLDELYVTPAARGCGLGRAGLAAVEAGARSRGVRILHLEVEHDKPAAHALYRRSGFADRGRALMSKPLLP